MFDAKGLRPQLRVGYTGASVEESGISGLAFWPSLTSCLSRVSLSPDRTHQDLCVSATTAQFL